MANTSETTPAAPDAESIRRHQDDHLFRFSNADADSADDKKRTIQVAFASEEPVLRTASEGDEKLGIAKKGTKYWEVLSHKRGDYDLSDLDGGKGDVLDEHDDSKQIGKVNRARVSRDGVSRAALHFDFLSDLSKTRYEQMKRGERTGVSTGYWHTGFAGDDGDLDGYPVKRVQWAADEVSSVRRPADKNRSGVRRSADGKWSCLGCGNMFDRAELNDDYECQRCDEAMRSETEEERQARAKAQDEKTISHNELRAALSTALNNDKRFKAKLANGDLRSDFSVHDIHQVVGDGDADDYAAIVSSPAWSGKYFKVDFAYDGKTVTLGEETEVEPKMAFEAVGRGLSPDGRLIRADSAKKPYGDVEYADPGYQKDGKKRYPIDTAEHAKAAWSYINQKSNSAKYSPEHLAKVKGRIEAACKKFGVEISEGRSEVDSEKLLSAVDHLTAEQKNNLRQKLMPEPTTQIDEAAVRTKLTAELEPQIRSKVRGEIEGDLKAKSEKRSALQKEIRALAGEYIKSHGKNWAGKPGEVVVVGERIRAFEQEAYEAPEGHSDSEIRSDFKQKCGELIRGSRPPRDQVEAASLDDSLASRVSLKRLYNAAAEDQRKGVRAAVWMPKDGAEFEADTELRRKALDFPGGNSIEMAGVCLPVNMRVNAVPTGRMARGLSRARLTRDALAGDFATAGALIAPEFKFPTIELLRNKMALGLAGITVLGGVIGNLVLPRQTGATTSQSLAEGAILAAYDQAFDQIRMAPHRIGSKQLYSRLALLQQTDDFEAIVMNDHMAQNALRADYLGLNGAGANDEPLGILNQVGIGVVTFGGSASAAYKNCVALETAIRKSNIDEAPSYITTSTVRGTLRITPATLTGSTVVSGESNALWDGEELIGREAVDSQQVPGDVLVALVGRHVVMAQWGGWQVVLDTLTQADADKIKLSMNTYIDYALRHPQAIARSADSLASLT